MANLEFDSISYRLNGRRIYLNSGEFPYFRVPRADWRTRMRLFRAAGGNMLATYVPWLVHEPEEGRFRFRGKPWVQLEAFLDTAAEERLLVLARPGPYVYSELVYDGLPRWLCDGYPALRAKNRAGRDFRRSSISYLHPLFLEKARRWYDRVCPLLARYAFSRGGPVALVQIDNEMAGIHTWFGSLDYNRATMGFGREDGRYPRWLAARYGTPRAAGAAYGIRADSFAGFGPPPEPAAGDGLPALRRRRDYLEFYLGTLAEYGGLLAGWMRAHGLDMPIVHNAANPSMNALFREVNAALKPGGFALGSDHYYTLNQDWAQNNPTPQYAARAWVSLESLRLLGAPPTVFELPGGSLSDWPPIGREDAQACYFANLAMGMKGHNYYIFTGGPNPPGCGGTGDIYDYGASVGADGSVRPLYRAQKAVGQFMKKAPFFPAARREADCRLLLDWDAARAEYWTRSREPFAFAPQEAWEFTRKGLLTAALCAGFSPEMTDLETEADRADTALPVLAATGSVMAAALQRRLAAFVRRGGRLMLGPVFPAYDERLRPCTILRRACGAGRERVLRDRAADPRFTGVGPVPVNGAIAVCARPPRGAVPLGVERESGACLAWIKAIPGGGRVLWLGAQWSHGMRAQEALLRMCLDRLAVKPVLACTNPNVWCTLWTAGDRRVLFAMNLLVARQEAQVTVRPAGKAGKRPGQIRLALPGMTVKTVIL